MHGRLKIKESEEIEREKNYKLKKKAEFFKKSLDSCLDAKLNGNYDEQILKLNYELLTSNPDVNTLWNMRRESFLIQKEKYEKKLLEVTSEKIENNVIDKNLDLVNKAEEKNEIDKENEVDEEKIKTLNELKETYDKLCKEELDLTEHALIKNPKSYTAWHHRFWIISLMENPNYMREFQLCEMYLKKDGRNFHCWDYRTMLCNFFNRSLIEELQFSLNKIKDDISAFSYSTLYYRSLILTKASQKNLINFSELWQEEYDMILNALFTEPNDQALWIYLNWLLKTNFEKSLSLNEKKTSQITKILFNKDNKTIFLHFNYNTFTFPFESFQLLNDNDGSQVLINIDCKLFNRISNKVWFTELSIEDVKKVIFTLKNSVESKTIELTSLDNFWLWEESKKGEIFKISEMPIKKDQLKSLLWLKESENDIRWVNLVLSNFLELDPIKIFNELVLMDPLRKNYYLDQISKFKFKLAINEMNPNSNILDISRKKLTVLYFLESFSHITVLNLSHNEIKCLNCNLNELISVKELILDDNLIDSIKKNIKLLNLNLLSLKNNRLNQASGLENLAGCIKLEVLNLNGNSIKIDDLDNLKKIGIQCNLN